MLNPPFSIVQPHLQNLVVSHCDPVRHRSTASCRGDVEIHWESPFFGQHCDLFDKMVIGQPLEISNTLEITIL